MQTNKLKKYSVNLTCEPKKTFRTIKAANSLDINIAEKCRHNFSVLADIDTDFNIGVILGASGSGKTTLAKSIYGDNCFDCSLDLDTNIIDQLPEQYSYDDCAKLLNGVGLTSVPCWIRPVKTLSNGQKARTEFAFLISKPQIDGRAIVIDEWTSVVDRTVAKVMSHCIQKMARRENKKVILLSCHYDILEWLNPDWVIDCNKEQFQDRRSLRQPRQETLSFNIREVDRKSWKYFSKYHYLSSNMPGGRIKTYGLFDGDAQIGFECFANYIPIRNKIHIYHSNRCVIHPDYAGFGLGIKFINACSKIFKKEVGAEIRATFSSTPLYKARINDPNWKLIKVVTDIGMGKNAKSGINKYKTFGRTDNTFRTNVKVFTFKYVGP